MLNKTLAATLLALLAASAAQAQSTTACSCNPSAARTASASSLSTLLQNKMVCGNVGGEVWQEHHNSSGALWDYKAGPSDKVDPSAQVGTYTVNADNTVTYAYGDGGGTYTYEVCFVTSSADYTFCGAAYGGRNITGLKIGGSGLQACSAVQMTAPALKRR